MRRAMTVCFSFCPMVAGSVLSTGCAGQRTWQAYTETMKAAYLDWVESPYIPTHEEVKAAGVSWGFNRSLDEVWRSCVDVGAQYSAVLASRGQASGSRQLVLTTYLPSGYFSYTYRPPLVLLVSAQPLSSGRTEVAVAGLSPIDRKFMDLPQNTPSTSAAGDTDLQVYEAISSRLTTQSASASGSAYTRSPSYAETTVNRFFSDLSVQMLGPLRWQALRAAEPRLDGGRVQGQKPRKAYRRKEIENKTGDFVSASLRRSHVIVADSGVSEALAGIVRDLRHGAGQADCPVRTYVIASPEVNAFALPNGDVFVCSGLLDSLDDRNELAYVLGHELDHLLQHDTLERLERADSVRITQYTLLGVVGAAGPIISGAMGAGATAGASAGTMAAQQATSSAITSTVSTVGMMLGDAASAAIVEGYSQRSELRADANTARYALAAGYDPAAALGVLAKLQAIVEAADAQTTIKSSLINAKPGLTKRIERMEATLAKLGVARTGGP